MITLRSLLALALLSLPACGTWYLPDDTANQGPIESYELDGTYCSYKLCLTVTPAQQTGLSTAIYQWSSPACNETGRLSGGLEFTPDIGPLCMAPEYALYSAAGSWTATGIELKVDVSTQDVRAGNGQPIETVTLELEWRPQ